MKEKEEINHQEAYYKRQSQISKVQGVLGLIVIMLFGALFVGALIVMF